MVENSEVFIALAGSLEADEGLQSAAQALFSSYLSLKTDTKYAAHCAFLVASRKTPGQPPLSLRQVWTSLPEVHIKDFFTTLQLFLGFQSLEASQASSLLSLPSDFTFGYTFYRKFEELWDAWVDTCALYKPLAWLLFLNLRGSVGCLRDLSRTAFVLIGVLRTVLKQLPSLQVPTHLSFIGTLLAQSLDTESPGELINQVSDKAREMMKGEISLEELIAGQERTYEATLGPDSVDERLFLSPGKFLGVQRSAGSGVCPTPISQNIEVTYWLIDCRKSREDGLISSLEMLEKKEKIESRLVRFRADLSHNIVLKRLSPNAIHLYLYLLVQTWDQKKLTGSEADFLESYRSEDFHRSLLALAGECLLYSENSAVVPFEEVLQVAGIAAFDFWKLLVLALPHFPRSLKAHFRLIETKIVCSLAWERTGTVNHFLQSLDQDSLSDDSEGPLPVPAPAVIKFFEHAITYMGLRLRQLATYLQLEDQVREAVWTAVKFLMSEQTEVVVGRHLDQIVLCTVYNCSQQSKEVTWKDVKEAYEQANPEEVSIVCRAVKATFSVLSIEDFHQRVIRPRLIEMRRSEPGPPRIPSLSPLGPLPSLPQTSPGLLPLKSPFRSLLLSPASQRLYADSSVRPSDRRLDLDLLERDLQSGPPAFLAPVLSRPVGLHLPRLDPAP